MEHIILSILTTVVTSALGAALGFISVERKRTDSMREGLKILLFAQLRELYDMWICHRGFVPLDVKSEVMQIYRAYSDLGGNGVGTAMKDKMMEAPIHKPGDER